MSKQIIQGLWIGPQLREIEIMSIRSFLSHGFEYHLYIYEDVKNIPEGTVIKNANTILDYAKLTRYGKKYAIFSDWFRWELLYKNGGIWMDMDMICLRPFHLHENDFPLFAKEGLKSKLFATGFLAFKKGDFLADIMRKSCQYPNKFTPYDSFRYKIKKTIRNLFYKNNLSKIPWGESGGPKGFTKAIAYYKLDKHVIDQNLIYPIHGSDFLDIFVKDLSNMHKKIENSYTIHLFNELISRNYHDVKKLSNKDSLYNFFQKKYL